MSKEKILVIEDDADIQELVRYNLAKEAYQVITAATGEDGLDEMDKTTPDLIILDLMLPGIDGFEVCKIVRQDEQTRYVPVIMLTAKGEESDVVTGLELGADDYITKPFSPKVLLARIRAILRRKPKPEKADENTLVRIHDLVIHPGRHEVRIGERPVDLTLTEFRVLQFLARRPGWVFTRSQIVENLHGDDYAVTDRAIDVQIVGLRKKLGEAGQYIETVRGVGYRFKE